ncbi:MAG: type II toxin-antitoxin system VapC family toxin [Terriglobia bacterium]
MILLDTHVLAWLLLEPQNLSPAAASAIRRARRNQGIALAAISLWELARLFSQGLVKGRGTVETSVRTLIEESGAEIRPITPEIAALAWQFPEDFPHDPADRLIAATARAEGMTLITHDQRIRQSPLLKTVW